MFPTAALVGGLEVGVRMKVVGEEEVVEDDEGGGAGRMMRRSGMGRWRLWFRLYLLLKRNASHFTFTAPGPP
jgi:hypothetical protein